jgi:hypothetical protein
MTTRPEAILYRILEQCSVAGGSPVDAGDPVVNVFLRRGLLAMRDGSAVAETTDKGREAMRLVFGTRARNNGCAEL